MRTLFAATLSLLSATACGTIDDFEVVVADEAVIDGTLDGNQGLGFGGSFMGLDLKTERTFDGMAVPS